MNEERLILKGRLADVKKALRENELKARALLISIRNILNPYDNIASINTEQVVITAKMLHDTVTNIKALKDNLQSLTEALDG